MLKPKPGNLYRIVKRRTKDVPNPLEPGDLIVYEGDTPISHLKWVTISAGWEIQLPWKRLRAYYRKVCLGDTISRKGSLYTVCSKQDNGYIIKKHEVGAYQSFMTSKRISLEFTFKKVYNKNKAWICKCGRPLIILRVDAYPKGMNSLKDRLKYIRNCETQCPICLTKKTLQYDEVYK